MAKYGIRIQGASNTLVIWIPKEDHGTSLQNIAPKSQDTEDRLDSSFFQRGLAFVTPQRLPGVWKKYIQAKLKWEEAIEELFGPEASSGEIFE